MRSVQMESGTKSIDCIRLSRVIISILLYNKDKRIVTGIVVRIRREILEFLIIIFFSFKFFSPIFPWLNGSSIMFSKTYWKLGQEKICKHRVFSILFKRLGNFGRIIDVSIFSFFFFLFPMVLNSSIVFEKLGNFGSKKYVSIAFC